MLKSIEKVDLAEGDILIVTGGSVSLPGRVDPGFGIRPSRPEVSPPIVLPPTREELRAKLEEILIDLQPKLDEIRAKLDEIRGQVTPELIEQIKARVQAKIEEIREKLSGLSPEHPIAPPGPGRPSLPEIPWDKIEAKIDEIKAALAEKSELIKAKLEELRDKITSPEGKDKIDQIRAKVEALKQALLDKLEGLGKPEQPLPLPPEGGEWRQRIADAIARAKEKWGGTACAEAVRQALEDFRAGLGSPEQPLPPEWQPKR